MPERILRKNTFLTSLSVAYKNDHSIAAEVLPIVKVDTRSDAFIKRNKESALATPDDHVGKTGKSNEISWGTGEGNYSVKDHALKGYVSKAEADDNKSPMKSFITTNRVVNDLLDNNTEVRAANVVFNADSYAADNKTALSGTSKWKGADDDPLEDVKAAIAGCWVRANMLVFGAEVWDIFRSLPEIVDAVNGPTRQQGQQSGMASLKQVAELLEVNKILVGRRRKMTSKKGQALTQSYVWGKHLAALYVESSPGLEAVSFGYTIQQMLKTTFNWFDPDAGVLGSDVVKVAFNADEKVIADDCGYLIQNVVA